MTRPAHKTLPVGTGIAIAFFAGPVVWIVLQQGEGGLTYLACGEAGIPLGGALALAALVACVAAGVGGWRLSLATASPTLRFVGRISAGMAAILAVAVLFIGAAVWLVPSCAR